VPLRGTAERPSGDVARPLLYGAGMNYGFVIDTRSCIGCHACSTACKSENQVPLGVNRTWVKSVETGRYPDVTRSFQVTRCNHCSNPPCVRSCPVTAMYQRDDGIVEFDPDVCIGCKACLQACPYDAIHMDPDSKTASKCHFCSHRIEVGLEPACVVVCPEHAILAGDMDDPSSEIARVLATHSVTVRKPEQGTSPKLFYIQGSELALHPSATAHQDEFMCSDVRREDHGALLNGDPAPPPPPAQPLSQARSGVAIRAPQPQGVPSDGPVQLAGRAAGQMVQVGWNAQHDIPWHWPIPAYLVTKALAGGLGLVAVAHLDAPASFRIGLLGLALLMLAITTGLLLYDLERPERFLYLLTRPQWRSWVARAAWILTSFTAVCALWLGAELFGVDPLVPSMAVLTVPLATLTGIYTAFLFAQAEGRDFWQSQATPIHMGLQTLYLGALGGAGIASVVGLDPDVLLRVAVVTLIASGLTLLLGEFGTTRPGETAARVQHDIQWGRWRRHFWLGGIGLGHMVPLALLIPMSGWLAWPALLAAGAGMFLYELAFVMAPQQVPNS